MNPQQIRDHYLSRLRSLFRLIRKLESLYPDAYPDAPADAWRAAIEHVAARIKSAPDSELQEMAGSHLALRNMVALSMQLDTNDGHGGTSYGHRVLDIDWNSADS